MAEKSIYLVSRSPRRRDLLKQIGVDFEMLLLRADPRRGVDVDETPLRDELPGDYALRIARMKAQAGVRVVSQRGLRPKPILAADTTVVLGEEIVGKPENAAHAERILAALSGREHQVISVVAVAFRDQLDSRVSASSVWFRTLTDAEIRRYVASGEPVDKAGAYAIQGKGALFVARMEGSYSGIMGLPLAETAALLQKFGVSLL
jgi:nucleoside triphosphate pyrophosphatase